MTQNSSLRFSLEESIWFKKGQEVEELLSITLEPHITIQEQEQYVLIRGYLELQGDYKEREEVVDSDEGWEEERTYGKLVAYTNTRETGESEFSHRFPVDITIPKLRVVNLSDIDVFVDSFDYNIPETACLKLHADLTVTGIQGESEQPQAKPEYALESRSAAQVYDVEDDVELVEYEPPTYHEEEDSNEEFYVEARKVEEEEEVNVPIEYYEEEYEAPQLEYSDVRGEQDSNVLNFPGTYEEESSSSPESTPSYSEEESSSSDELFQEEEESSEMKVAQKGKKPKGYDEAISLTEFFTRKEQEETSKLRVYIVQNGDTLEQIAERYGTSAQTIIRDNSLDVSQDVYEGQVLTISETYVLK
ncbi:hypothetical protein Q73_10375 [Bacillus coahuilensis m2-6]|uniref:LysM domain-containing protein n=1 Tax=Bacillus coahuilensis p1.1.43 TaxID=1150625 RepID=A0A147K743_9BACI|nr:stage VI sporulation protein D [Bacillus coahuilensis]KUP05887.1 hypothetical protein Q75_10940 [Bacillus coahuilensis p1.1.43]KUP06983.1 hypothetical protein Q73_10375 [Bacillus coahuilensis m2-6]